MKTTILKSIFQLVLMIVIIIILSILINIFKFEHIVIGALGVIISKMIVNEIWKQ
jgi:hypothetical protein